MRRIYLFSLLMALECVMVNAQTLPEFTSPNGNLSVQMLQNSTQTYMKVKSAKGSLLGTVYFGVVTNVENFSNSLAFLSASEPALVTDEYDNIEGKCSHVKSEANEVTAHFTDKNGSTKFDIVLRAYDKGVAFKYVIPENDNVTRKFTDESTTFMMPSSAHRWLQEYTTSYEGDFPYQAKEGKTGNWGFPALFENNKTFTLITESNVNEMYCSSHLDNTATAGKYKTKFPNEGEGGSSLAVQPSWKGQWTSPWRVMIIGGIGDIVESTLVEDLASPCAVSNTSWIKPGSAAWVYWAYNHGTRDYQICKQYVDLAYNMGWPYVLFDWEWESMGNGGNIQDACNYARSKGVKPMVWYDSSNGKMKDHNQRVSEFQWLKSIGVYGIKVDFFDCDKQDYMKYYLGILEDAAQYQILVNFHGATVPKGWRRTYPNLMSTEAVYGAEWYNNNGYMTDNGPRINCLLPYTRNVVGPMDYTPVAFTNSQNPHTTSYAHELALSVAFESGIQHWADRPEGFYALPQMARRHMEKVPTAWDETRFISGYPGKSFIVARRKGDMWYIGGLQGESKKATFEVPLTFLDEGEYEAGLMLDGADDKSFAFSARTVSKDDVLSIDCLSKGGFVITLSKEGNASYSDLIKLQTLVKNALSKAEGHIGFNTGSYNAELVEELSASLDASKSVSVTSSASDIYYAYQRLLVDYSNFQENGKVEGGVVEDKNLTQNVTMKYLVESRNFTRESGNDNTIRFGKPANWTVENYYITKGSEGVKQGIDRYLGYDCLSLGVWDDASNATGSLAKARMYRSVDLPAGRYFFGCSYPTLYTLSKSYMFVATTPLTAAETESKALAYTEVSNAGTDGKWYGVRFELTEDTKVYLGWNADLTTASQQEFRVGEVALLRYLETEGAYIPSECVEDDPLYVGANQCAEQLTTKNAYSSDYQALLNAQSGNIVVVGDMNLDYVDKVSVFVNTTGSLSSTPCVLVLIDDVAKAWCNIPIEESNSGQREFTAAVTEPLSGVHNVKLRFYTPLNLWGVQFNKTIPDGINALTSEEPNCSAPIIYNLSGQRLSSVPKSGIYIIKEGEKVYKMLF